MNNQDSHHQFTRLTGEAFLARAAAMLGGFVANVLIVRALGVESKGTLTILAVWSSLLAAFFSNGLHLAAVYELGARPRHLRRLLSVMLPYVLAASLIVMGGTMLVQQMIKPAVISATLLTTLFAGQLLNNLSLSLLIGLRRMFLVNRLAIFVSSVYPLLIIALWLTKGALSIPGVALCMAAIPFLAAGLGLVFLQKNTAQLPVEQAGFPWPPFLRYALKASVMSMGSLLYMQIVMLTFSTQGTLSQIGVFSIAMMFMDLTTVIPTLLASFVLPRWSGLSGPDVARRASRVMRLTHPLVILLAAGAALAATLLARPIFGRDFSSVGVLAWMMIPGAWATIGITVLSNYFLSQNRLEPPTATVWLGTFLGGLLAWCLIPGWGCIGAALSLSVSRLASLFWIYLRYSHSVARADYRIFLPDHETLHTWKRTIQDSLRTLGLIPTGNMPG